MKKLHKGNKSTFFKGVKEGDHFSYSFSTMDARETRRLAEEAGVELLFKGNTTYEVLRVHETPQNV
jgi:hypothetical protein